MKKQNALTVIEIIVVVGIIAILALFMTNIVGGCNNRGSTAEEEMRTYVNKLYPDKEIIGVACTNRDTNADGYISCVATIDTDAGPAIVEKQIAAECATQFLGWNTGCKPTVGYMPAQ